MADSFEFITGGGVTSPQGFHAGAVYAGIKKKARDCLDLGILYSQVPCATAAVFTANRIQAAPVVLSRRRLQSGRVVAVVVNSGCANACTGEDGLADAEETAALAAKGIGVSPEDVLVASTGVIGQRLPMDKISDAIGHIALSREGGHELTKAIMTTDTVPKAAAVGVGGGFTIGGTAKGSGMIHPDLATLLCFLTTDASVEASFLQSALRQAADVSFNMVSVDGDTSTNDMVLLMANGLAGGETIAQGSRQAGAFQQALEGLCIHLARAIARDGEGATKLIEVTVSGAPSVADARRVARTIVSSPLVKTAVYGSDPNWGRVIAAAGRSGVAVVEAKVDLYIGGACLLIAGRPQPFDRETLVKILDKGEVQIAVNLNLGSGLATAWGCDLSEEYVVINSQYTT
ncbi:MAG: bifunctional glutamate N-acetyltransferase/amino-acid acetyltransferase ArgJ [Chloroflexota bacterium]